MACRSSSPPESRNAASTLVILGSILELLFLGVAWIGHAINAVPSNQANVVAQIGLTVVGGGPLFYVVQISAAFILSLAANISFNGFPLLAAVMSRDGYLPHQFSHRGLRLAYSNGIIALGALAVLLVIAFRGETHALIPLFAVGVFLCFTLSQFGMVRHWQRLQGQGWRSKLAINGIGGITTAVVTLIVVSSKFLEGAWIVVLLIPLLVDGFMAIHTHYVEEARELDEGNPPKIAPEPHNVLLPVAKLNKAVSETLAYGVSLGGRIRALHVVIDEDAAEELRKAWAAWGIDVPLVMVPSPYRTVVGPLLHEIHRTHREAGGRVTVLLPEIVPRRWWQEALHNQTVLTLQLTLRGKPNVVVTTLPVRLHH
jgi:amino acid permease-like protein